jgi:hypothetical protein
VSVAGAVLPEADQIKVLGVIFDRRLTFESHATSVARARNYHVQAIRHIRHLVTTDLAVTLVCGLILSRMDYCNALLYGVLASSIQKLQRAQNMAARVVLQACTKSPCTTPPAAALASGSTTDCLYKLAVITSKTQHTSMPAYLNRHIFDQSLQLRSSAARIYKLTTRNPELT